MLVKERQALIVDTVNRKGLVEVKALSERFDVTEDSIRKDLTLLEKKGLLRKTYGGAVRVRTNTHERFAYQRKGKNIEQKQAIARECLKLIDEGDVIYLDISTANIELIKLIIEKKLRITVVTCMIDVMLEFTKPVETNLVFIGGKLSRGRDGFVGGMTNKQLGEFRFDKAFIGAAGVDADKNKVYTYTIEEATTKQVAMEDSTKIYMIIENSKFSSDGIYRYANVDDFTGVILDAKPSEEIKEKLKKLDIEILYED